MVIEHTLNPTPQAIGVDLSLTNTGIAFPDGTCRLVGRDGVLGMSVVEQQHVLNTLAVEIAGPIMRWPDLKLVVIEGLDMSQSYGGSLERVVLWWKVVEDLTMAGIPVCVAPSGVPKVYATGNGNAKKGEVIAAVTRQWPQFETRGNDNLTDATAMCALGMHLLGSPLSQVTKQQERAVEPGRTRFVQNRPPAKKSARLAA